MVAFHLKADGYYEIEDSMLEESYETTDLKRCAQIDQDNYNQDISSLVAQLDTTMELKVEVTSVPKRYQDFVWFFHEDGEDSNDTWKMALGKAFSPELLEKMGNPFTEIAFKFRVDLDTGEVIFVGVPTREEIKAVNDD
jgi:hypothetical protein